MANRHTFPAHSLDRSVVTLFGSVTFGGSGAVVAVDANGFTVTKPSGTGLYRITLEDKWEALAAPALEVDNNGTPADVKVQISDVDLANRLIDVQYISGTGAANATSGHTLYITLHLRNSSVPRKGA
jgi:hypothetical protein